MPPADKIANISFLNEYMDFRCINLGFGDLHIRIQKCILPNKTKIIEVSENLYNFVKNLENTNRNFRL